MIVFGGIDPGATGSICLLFRINKAELFHVFLDFKMDSREILAKLTTLPGTYDCKIYLEDVHSKHGMSAGSNFTFGGAVREAYLLPYLAGIDPILVQPKEWQKVVGVTKKGKEVKPNVLELALNLYPKITPDLYGPRGGLLDGRVDALMIAHYARIKHGDYNDCSN